MYIIWSNIFPYGMTREPLIKFFAFFQHGVQKGERRKDLRYTFINVSTYPLNFGLFAKNPGQNQSDRDCGTY